MEESNERIPSETDKWIQYAIALFPQIMNTIQRNNRRKATSVQFTFSIDFIPADKDDTL